MFKNILESKLFFFTQDCYVKKLVFFGLLFRFILFIIFYTTTTIFPDSYGFIELANNLLQFDLSGYNGERSPGYSLLLFFGFGKTWLTVIYQFFIGVLSSVIIYKTIINLNFSKRSSFLIVLLMESFLNVFFYETSILIESLSLFFIALLMFEISKGYLISSDYKKDLWVGFILGYLTLIKPFYAYIPFLLYGMYVLNDFNFKKIIGRKLIILVFPLIAYFGWSYVNKINTGHFVSTTFFGLNISQNCVYFAEKGPKEYEWISKPYVKYREIYVNENKDVAMSIWEAYDKKLKYMSPNFPDLSAELGEYALQTIKDNPVDYIKQVVFKSWFDFWKPRISWNYEKFNFKYANIPFLLIWRMQEVIMVLVTLAFFPISFIYILEYFKKFRVSFELFSVVLVWVSSILQGLVTYGTNSKYRFPFEFIIFLVVILYLRKKHWIPKRLNTF